MSSDDAIETGADEEPLARSRDDLLDQGQRLDRTANEVNTAAVIRDREEIAEEGPGRAGDLRDHPDGSDATF